MVATPGLHVFEGFVDDDFLNPANWNSAGTPTPANMAGGDTYRVVAPAVLHGTALNAGTLEIEATGSLTVDSAGSLDLASVSEITGTGTLTVQGVLRLVGSDNFPVNCPLVLNNTGTPGRVLEIPPGTELQNSANVTFTAGEALVRGSWKHNQSPLRVLPGATIAGRGIIDGELRLFGRLKPATETATDFMQVFREICSASRAV